MSDNIQNRDIQVGIEQAWHKKTIIPENGIVTKELAFPWNPVYRQLEYRNIKGHPVKHGKWVIPVADDDYLPLGYGTPVNLDTYTCESPGQVWDFVADVLKGTGYQIVSAGTVGNRSKFFVSARLNELSKIITADGKEHWMNFNGKGSLDKSMKKQLNVSAITLCCANTVLLDYLADHSVGALRIALNMPNLMQGADEKLELGWTYRHSKNMTARVANDNPAMEQAVGYSAIIKATFDSLLTKPCDKDKAAAIYTGFICKPASKNTNWPEELSTRAKNMVDEHVWCFERGAGCQGKTESDLLNGFTEPRTRGYQESDRDAWDVYETSEMGVYAKSKSEFLETLTVNRDKLGLLEAKGRDLLKTV